MEQFDQELNDAWALCSVEIKLVVKWLEIENVLITLFYT